MFPGTIHSLQEVSKQWLHCEGWHKEGSIHPDKEREGETQSISLQLQDTGTGLYRPSICMWTSVESTTEDWSTSPLCVF